MNLFIVGISIGLAFTVSPWVALLVAVAACVLRDQI
jgi:membrane protein DedA with SNARE-associated domain